MNLTEFLDSSYTAFHAAANVCKILEEHGYTRLQIGAPWHLSIGSRHYVVQNDSSVVAFCVGGNGVFSVCESHTDSPSFKLKGGSLVPSAGGVNRINTERYGGGLLYTFFDRPLKIAGRILFQTEHGVESQLVASDYNVVIPSQCIHHNPTANESFSVNLQNDTLPLFSQKLDDVCATLTDKSVLDADLYAVPATPAFFAGAENEFLCSPRLDNLTSVYTSVCALVQSTPDGIAVCACLDSEEVGSGTRQGSPDFLNVVLRQIGIGLNFDACADIFARENGMVLSVDNGHAVHPAHPEKSDPKMFVKLNGGVVVKHHPNYATDGLTSAIFKSICAETNVPVQDYYNRSDVRCGGTLGLATASKAQTKTCDIGLAQLAMHSACETVGAHDVERMRCALKAFFEHKAKRNSK